jgi:hypothetical protein
LLCDVDAWVARSTLAEQISAHLELPERSDALGNAPPVLSGGFGRRLAHVGIQRVAGSSQDGLRRLIGMNHLDLRTAL